MPTVETLIADLHSPDPEVRIAAADGLGQFAAFHEDTSMLPEAVPYLIEALQNDPVRGVRLAVAYALGAMGDACAVPALLDVLRLSDHDRGLQLVIVKGLGKLGDPRAVPSLIEARQSDQSRCVSVAAAKALERIGTLEALAVVKQWRSKQKVSS